MADIDSGGNKNFTFGYMKMNCWLILGVMVATSAFAQDCHQRAAADSARRQCRHAG